MRKTVSVLAIAFGVLLMGTPVVNSMFGGTADAERILDRFEFLTLGENPDRYLDDAETTRLGSAELVEEAVAAFALGAGMSGSELAQLTQRRFPALATAQDEIRHQNEFSARYSEQLAAVRGKFQSVYDTPVGGVPLTVIPWLLLVAGLACLVAGVVALRTDGREPVAVILALGVAMLLGPLVLSAPGKASDGKAVKDFASLGLTPEAATTSRQATETLDALVKEADRELLPNFARRQGVSPTQLEDELRDRFPVAAELLTEWNVIGPRLARLSGAVGESVGDFESAKKLPTSFPVWLLLVAGAALSLSAGIMLARDRADPAED